MSSTYLSPSPAFYALIMIAMITSPSQAFGASVKRKLKKRGVVVINEGSNSGVKQGDEVCFIDDAETTLGCGTVKRVQANRSFVKVQRPILRQIRRGMIATYSEPSQNQGGRESKIFGLSLAGFANIFPVYKANLVNHTNNTPPYWKAVSSPKLPQFRGARIPAGGAAGELKAIPLRMTIGGRYDFVQPSINTQLLYKPVSQLVTDTQICSSSAQYEFSCYTKMTLKESSWGVWLQYLHPFNITDDIELAFGIGVDMDRSTLNISYLLLSDDSSKEGYTLFKDTKFVLYSFGVRVVPLRFTLLLGEGFGLFAEGAGIIGLYGINQLVHDQKTVQDPNIPHATTANEKITQEYVNVHYKKALDHKPGIGGFGHIGVHFAF